MQLGAGLGEGLHLSWGLVSAFPEGTMQMNHVCCQELPLLKNVSASCKDWLCSVNKGLFILWALSAHSYSIHNYLVLFRLHCTIPVLPWRVCELRGENDGNALNLVYIWYMYIYLGLGPWHFFPHHTYTALLSQPRAFSLSPEKVGLCPSLIYGPVTISDTTTSWT